MTKFLAMAVFVIAAIAASMIYTSDKPQDPTSALQYIAPAAGEESAPDNAEQAKEFIVGRLKKISNSKTIEEEDSISTANYDWNIEVRDLGADTWVWEERELDTSTITKAPLSVFTNDTQIVYSVSPKDLSYPVQISTFKNFPAIKIECLTAKCIKSVGKKQTLFTQASTNEQNVLEIDEMKADNLWPFQDEETAARVAKALNVYLKHIGAKERVF